ncbi:MAG: hypothetical protein WBQ59_00370 [Candidatus Acidiferrum sp.]
MHTASVADAVARAKPTNDSVEERERGVSFLAQRTQPQISNAGTKRVMATAMSQRVEANILP